MWTTREEVQEWAAANGSDPLIILVNIYTTTKITGSVYVTLQIPGLSRGAYHQFMRAELALKIIYG